MIKRIASPLSPSEVWSHGAKPLRSLCVRILTLYSACFVHNFGTWMPGVKPGPAATHLLCALCDFTESADELAAIVELCDALASSHEGFSELKEWTHRAKASSRRLRERLELQLVCLRINGTTSLSVCVCVEREKSWYIFVRAGGSEDDDEGAIKSGRE